ncbi:hypothetical protein R1flu_008040 [Riccia fluitans]|uniref:Uncharacterized protein n=1 Tax=Riccia fluitans TaxID=41844 RepID=A0ABD1YB81_9MARC
MKIKKDGHLVEPLDLDVDAKSQKTPKKKQMGSEQPSLKRPRSEFDPKDGNKGNLPSAMETSRKEKRKVIESSHRPDMDTDVDVPAEERRTLKIGMTVSRLEMDPPLSTPVDKLPIEAVITYLPVISQKKSLLHQAKYHLMGYWRNLSAR